MGLPRSRKRRWLRQGAGRDKIRPQPAPQLAGEYRVEPERAAAQLRRVQAEVRPAVEGAMANPDASVLEGVLRRDRVLVVAALVAIVALAWTWLLTGAGTGMSPFAMHGEGEMPGMPGMAGMAGMADMAMKPAVWTPGYAALMFLMWWVMMAAMMLPSATPMLLLYARINRGERTGGRPYVPTGIFAAGYL